MKKTNKVIAMVMLILLLFSSIQNIVIGATYYEDVNIVIIGECDWNLKFKRSDGVWAYITCTYVGYRENGKIYPAYCLNRGLDGVGEYNDYDVNLAHLIDDDRLWRVAINGFPYKTASELGVENDYDAFLATKQAVYCMIYNRDEEMMKKYEGIGEAGQRTVTALRNIVNTARNSNEIKISSQINIEAKEDWKIDSLDNKYISKTYKTSGYGVLQDYDVILSENLPDGAKLVDEKNNEKTKFKNNECFKILLPISELKSNSKFKITVKSKIETKPILYGKSPNSELQDYAITASTYEDGEGVLNQEYVKNDTRIKIIKQDLDTKERLKGAEFKLLDSNKNVIKSDIITDENGEAIIDNIMPGKYYLKETKVLDGYNVYSELIEIELGFNEEGTITVNNSKVKNTEVKTIKKNLSVSNEKKQSTITKKENQIKLPKTGM